MYYKMLKEYIKPELIENSKVKSILAQYNDELLNIINSEYMTYEDFRDLVRGMWNKDLDNYTENDYEFSSVATAQKGSYIYERRLRILYDILFRDLISDEEKTDGIIKLLNELMRDIKE